MSQRILLGLEEFDQLTSGKIIEVDGVQIALQDIGYNTMLQLINDKKKALYVNN